MPKNRLHAIEKELVARDKHRQFLTSPHMDKAVQATEQRLTELLVEHRTLKRLLPGNSSTWKPGAPSDPRLTVPVDEYEKLCLTANVACHAAMIMRQAEYKRAGGYVYEPRYDGMLLRLTYNKRGVLNSACTQGDGLNGQDVLHRISLIDNLPTTISGGQTCVTGIVVCTRDDYSDYCDHFSLEDTTPSHLVTYLMGKESDVDNSEDENNEDALPLYFIAFHAGQISRQRYKTYDKLKAWLTRQGFGVSDSMTSCVEALVWDGPYPTNGVILKQTDLAHWDTTPDSIWYNGVVALREQSCIRRLFLKDVFWYFEQGILRAKGICVDNSGQRVKETEEFILRYPTIYRKGKFAIGDLVEIDVRRKEIIGYLSTGFGQRIDIPKNCHYCDTPLTVTGPHQLACENIAHCPSHWSVRGAKVFSPDGLNLWPKGKAVDLGEHKPGSLSELMALANKAIPDNADHAAVRHVQKTLRLRMKASRVAHWLYATGLHGLSLSRCYVLEQALCRTGQSLNAKCVVDWLTNPERMQELFGLDSLTILSDAMSHREDLLAFLGHCPWPDEQQREALLCPALIAVSDEISAKHHTLTQRMKALGWCVDSTLTKKTLCYLIGVGGLSSHRHLAKRYGIPIIETESLTIDDILHYVEEKYVL